MGKPKNNKRSLIFSVIAVIVIAIITVLGVKLAVDYTTKEEVGRPHAGGVVGHVTFSGDSI